MPELIERLATAEGYDRWEVIADIGFHGPAAAEAVGPLVRFCEDERGGVHEAAACRSLGMIGPAAMAAVPMLLTRFRSEPDGRDGALEGVGDALVKIGPDPEEVFAHLLLEEEDTDFAELLTVLSRLGPTPTHYIIRAIREGGGQLSYDACCLLGNFGAKAADAVPALIDILRRSSPGDMIRMGSLTRSCGWESRRVRPCRRCGRYSPRRPTTLPVSDRVASPCPTLWCAWASRRRWRPSCPTYKTKSPGIRQTAILQLERLADDTPDAFPHLLAMLRDPVASVRVQAAGVIARRVANTSDVGLFGPPCSRRCGDSDAEVR